jgi:hypothetical protein
LLPFTLSFFHFFNPDELSLSRLLAVLLNPEGIHQQNTLYLSKLLEYLFLAGALEQVPDNLQGTVVTLEESFGQHGQRKRLDIVLEGENFVVGIENKPYARESPGQIAAYQNYIWTNCKDKKIKIFLFISGDYTPSVTHDVAYPPTVLMGYRRADGQVGGIFVEDLLNDTLAQCDNPYLRLIQRDLLNLLWFGVDRGKGKIIGPGFKKRPPATKEVTVTKPLLA